MTPLRIGTRPSRLAIWQAELVAASLRQRGERAILVPIATTGDVRADVPLEQLGTPAVFSRELDVALLEGRVDLAVHSLKDLPTTATTGLGIAAIGHRADPRDALVTRQTGGLEALPSGAVVATCSVRRQAQLLRARPDLAVVPLRGNVETRVRKLDESDVWSGILLAVAGLARLDLAHRITEYLDPVWMLPAPGQGAIAVTARTGDRSLARRIRHAFHHPPTARCVIAERALLHRLDAGCLFPVAALAEWRGAQLALTARVLSPDGTDQVEGAMQAPAETDVAAEAIGISLAERLIERGAAALLVPAADPARPHAIGSFLT